MTPTINDEDFQDALDRHGADPARWPAALRAPMTALAESSPAARTMLADARRLHEALDEAFAGAPVPLGLRTRILASVPRREPWLEWLTGRLWRPVGLACVPLALGFAFGMGVADDTGDLEDSVLVAFSDAEGFVDFDISGEDL